MSKFFRPFHAKPIHDSHVKAWQKLKDGKQRRRGKVSAGSVEYLRRID